ncbi:MAG: cell surface protein SprA [Chlorobi bacterium]|nr:cell surface protein SprA [Chlorobiota bacterium]MCI0714709.1 cell surface protein SprA [Chlorobiota bacterium]
MLAAVGLLFCSTKDTLSQGRDRSKYLGIIDTSLSYSDTSLISDTTRMREPVDSTARIKNFKYERTDTYNPQFGDYKSPLLLYGSNRLEYRVTIDSLNNVIIKETFEGELTKVPLVIPLDKYIEVRSKLGLQEQLYRIVAENYQIETEDDLEKLFKNITEITIPLPFTSETIFGPPTINLKINGIIDITASYQKSTNDLQTILQESQDQNNINFKQEVQVTTKGTVGDKLTIDADWNSQRTFEFENQLKLKYKGYPDEVIQSIEAGNVSLETKSNLIGSTQALFGVKAQFKLGPLTLTTIASQKKSEKKEVNITGGSVETPFEIPIWDYSENNYLLDEKDSTLFINYLRNGTVVNDVTEIEVWVIAEANNPSKRAVIAYDSLGNRPANGYSGLPLNDSDGVRLNGNFIKLDESEYTLNRYAGYITLNGNLQQYGKDAIAVAYKVNTSQGTFQYGDFVREVGSTQRLTLKLIRTNFLKSPDQNSNHVKLWNRLLKNIYHLGVRNVKNDPSNLTFNIYYNVTGQPPNPNYDGEGPVNGRSYMNLVGLDYRVNGNPTDSLPTGDGYFDFFVNNTIDLTNGNVIIPHMRPFSYALQQAGVSSDYIGRNDTVYKSSKNTAQQSGFLKFILKGVAKGDASSRYSLGFNVVEGSVKVFNGSVELVAGVDYTVDYSIGELVIRNASALVSGANLKITYETNDLFQLASKTLIGTRAELSINKTSYLGFTLINLKQQTLNDKIRIGEEPTNNTIIGFDASTDIKTNLLTKLVNKIPGYNTKEESILNLKGEIAFMLPDPNTKKSRIPSDNGEAVAYIDDFEGVKKIIPLGLNPLSWTLSSIPVDPTLVPVFNTDDERDSLMSRKRARLNWYNLINNVLISDVYPNRSIASNQNQSLTPMVFDIKPDTVGPYNYITQQEFVADGLDVNKWSGVFKFLNTSQTNLLDENINYIEVWMQVNGNNVLQDDSAKMIIDLGTISERIITSKRIPPNSTDQNVNYHTEDKDGSGQLDVGEDNGIDGRTDAEEVAIFGNGINGNDPSRDNYAWTQGSAVYTSFNGTQGNATNLTEAKRIDTEDLNNSGTLDLTNNYFEYVVPLKLDSVSVANHPFIAGGGNQGWYQFIIPLDEWRSKIGANASFTNIQYARVWFKGFSGNTQIKIVDFSLVGNQWVKSNKNDTSYNVSVVNIEDNSNIYQPPVPGDVLRQRDQTQVDQNVLSNEQSISLDVRNLLPGQGKYLFKSFTTRPIDLINYKILKLFVNGDSSFSYTNPNDYDAAVIVRIGADTANYYEYRAPVHADIRPGTPWNPLNEININLSEMTSVKQSTDTSGNIVYIDVQNGPPGSKYSVVGNPSIRDVRQIVLGIYNNNKDPIVTKALTGSVWFNEMRVLKTNDASGYAFTLSAGLKIADLAVLNLSFNKTDPNFHNLEGRFGTLNLANSWEISGTVNAHKVLNSLLSRYVSVKFKDFFTIPISFSHTEILDKPKYLPSTDVDLETAANNVYNRVKDSTGNTELAEYMSNQVRVSAQTLRIANRFSISGMKFTFPGDNFFVKQILNKIEINFVRNTYVERTPTLESKYAWDMNGNIGLGSEIDLMEKLNLKIGKFLPFGDEFKEAKMYFFFPFMPLAPLYTSSISMQGSFNRRRGDEKLRTQFSPNPTSRQFDAQRSFNLDWKFIENWVVDITGNYGFRTGSDLTFLETTNDSLRLQRSEGEIWDDIFFNNGLINWGKDLDYAQTVSINPKFNIPGLRDFVDLTSSYRVQYGWRASQYNVSLGSNVGYSSDFQSTAFLKLNQIFNIFKAGENKILGGAISSAYQDDKQDPADILKLLKTFVPEQLNITFSQSKQLTNPAISGIPGFGNFWMKFKWDESLGPSRLYQLGWVTEPGRRIPGVQLTDGHNLNNSVTFNTFINPIFPNNLKINFTYKITNASNKSITYNTDSVTGALSPPTANTESRTLTRPSFFISGDIVSSMGVGFNPQSQAKEIADKFESNVVSFPFPSWTLTLSGVEKFEMFSNFAQSVTIESGYSSEYKKVLSYDGVTPERTRDQGITAGFSPLIGVNFTFKPISEGNLTASFKLSKTDNYILEPNSANITNTATNDLSINASYTKSGFKVPLFGLSLENNLTISFSYTRTKNDPVVYRYDPLGDIWNTNSQTGSTSTTVSPSIQYNLSKSVTLQLFYKYTKVEPTGNNLQITTRTSNEAGLNVKLQIQ